jgi:hypothetical protein
MRAPEQLARIISMLHLFCMLLYIYRRLYLETLRLILSLLQ